MLNRYPIWKNLLIAAIVAMGFYYAAPNLYAPDPALQIGGASGSQRVDERLLSRAEAALADADIAFLVKSGGSRPRSSDHRPR